MRTKTIILAREDIQNPLHPFLWEHLCEDLGLFTFGSGDGRVCPESVELKVASASALD